jgi:hypothetical protein
MDLLAVQDGLDWLWNHLQLPAPRLLILNNPLECVVAANLLDQPSKPRSKPVRPPLPDLPLVQRVRIQIARQLPEPPRVHPAHFRAYDFKDELGMIRARARREVGAGRWFSSAPSMLEFDERLPLDLYPYEIRQLGRYGTEYLGSEARLLGEAVLGGAWMVIPHPKLAIVCRSPRSYTANWEYHFPRALSVEWEEDEPPYAPRGLNRKQLEQLGLEAFLAQPARRVLDEDVDLSGMPRRLVRVRVENDEPVVAVEVRCPTTGKHSLLRVPPQTLRCSEAVAWTFGFSAPEAYCPAFES